MNGARSLARVVRWAELRYGDFEQSADRLAPPFGRAEHDCVRYLAIEAANTWAVFLRTYYLASATGAWMKDGSRVSGAGRTARVEAALTDAVHFVNPKLATRSGPWAHSEEPNWLDPAIVGRLLAAHELSNATGFNLALGAGTRANERLLTFRNFVAHRDRRTALKVRDLARHSGIRASGDPMELPFHRLPKRPVSAFTDWIAELRAIIELCPN